jgi:hypothetical protein
MRIRKITVFLGIASTVSLIPMGLVFRAACSPRICLESYETIQEGMTRHQVEAILGGPPRWEVESKRSGGKLIFQAFNKDRGAQWWGQKCVISVFYDRKGVVCRKEYDELPFEPRVPSWWEVLAPSGF